jgi:hypothetical protein
LFSKLNYIRLKISKSSTLSLQWNVREYIDIVYYSTLHISEDLIYSSLIVIDYNQSDLNTFNSDLIIFFLHTILHFPYISINRDHLHCKIIKE